eukprot:m.131873 g.131873  ORF g.131873 m.131873 type:complete len:1107 (-) comp15916_c0_seq2:2000-5320(-)
MDQLLIPLVDPETENEGHRDPLSASRAGIEPFELVVTAATKDNDRLQLNELAKLTPESVQNAFLQHAAILLYEGRHYIKFGSHPTTMKQLAAYNLYYKSSFDWTRKLELFVTLILLALTLIEEPAAIHFFAEHQGYSHPQVWIASGIEVVCVAVITGFLYLRTRITGWTGWWQRRGNQFRAVIIALMLVDVTAGLSSEHYRHYRLLRLLRPLFLVDTFRFGGTRRVLQQTFYTSLRMADMVILLLTYVVLWAVVAHSFLGPDSHMEDNLVAQLKRHGIANHRNITNPYFHTFGDSFVSLFVGITTANYPDVSMPAMMAVRGSSVGFVIYMFFGCFFVVNFFLAVVYESFQRFEKRKETHVLLHKRRALRRAFALSVQAMRTSGFDGAWTADNPNIERLADYDSAPLLLQPDLRVLDFTTFHKLMSLYSGASRKQALLTFAYLTRRQEGKPTEGSHDSLLSLNEFFKLYEALRHQWKFERSVTLASAKHKDPKRWGATPLSAWFQHQTRFASKPAFELLVHFVILVNLVLVLVNAADANHKTGLHSAKMSQRFNTQLWEIVFFSFYVFEAAAKLLHHGRRAYFKSTWNRFDFGIVTVSVVGFAVEVVGSMLAHGASAAVDIHVVAVIFRCIRLLRVLRISESFRHVSVTMLFVVRKMVRYISVLLLAMYVFAIVGMAWFEHTVSRDCSFRDGNRAEQVCGESYQPEGLGYYQLQSFDNILLSFNTLFSLLIVNNWQFIMEGHVAVAPGADSVRIFFIAYYVLVVLVVLNVITAFLLDGFVKMHPYLKERETAQSANGTSLLDVTRQFVSRRLWGRPNSARVDNKSELPDHFVDVREQMEEALLVSVAEVDVLAAQAETGTDPSSDPSSKASAEASAEAVRRVDEARHKLYEAFMLSLARAAFEVTAANMRAITTQYTSEQRVVLCHVPTALGLAVSSSPSPLSTFQVRVLPWITDAYLRHTDSLPSESGTEAVGHRPSIRPSVGQDGIALSSSNGQWQGEGQYVARIAVPYNQAQSSYAGNDPDLAAVAIVFDGPRRNSRRVYLHYEASQPVTRDDINHALWGSHIESSGVTDDNQALEAVLAKPWHLHDCSDLGKEDQYEDLLFLD